MGEIIIFLWRDFPGHTVTFSGVCWYHRSRKASANCFKTSGKLKVAAVRGASFRCGEIRILDFKRQELPPAARQSKAKSPSVLDLLITLIFVA